MVRIYTGSDGQTHFEDLQLPVDDIHNVAIQAGAKSRQGKLETLGLRGIS